MNKTIEQIRKETPLSVTTLDNAIFEVIKPVKAKVYDVYTMDDGSRHGYWTLEYVDLNPGDRLRLLQCDDDESDNHYRIGDQNQKVIIPDSKMKYVSGNMGPRQS